MDASTRKIEVFAPFSAALDLTKLILFQPFDFSKWLVIGFAAFLALLGGGGGNGLNYNKKFGGNGNWSFRSTSHHVMGSANNMPGWAWPLIFILALLVLAVVIVLLWISSRGKFIFADCVVRNRGAIVEPWREFRKEGNSLFIFSLLVGVGILLVIGMASLPLLLPIILHGDAPEGIALIGGIALLAAVGGLVMIGWAIVSSFMIPVMYRQRCGAMEGFRGAMTLVTEEPGPVVLYILFSVVLRIAFLLIACVLTCLTCCVTAIPYVGTVLLLPIHVLFMSYLLLFVRQFGPDYDPWASIVPTAPLTPTVEPPPVAPPPGDQPPFQV